MIKNFKLKSMWVISVFQLLCINRTRKFLFCRDHSTNGRKSSNLVNSHEVICHFITLYLFPLPPYLLTWECLRNICPFISCFDRKANPHSEHTKFLMPSWMSRWDFNATWVWKRKLVFSSNILRRPQKFSPFSTHNLMLPSNSKKQWKIG